MTTTPTTLFRAGLESSHTLVTRHLLQKRMRKAAPTSMDNNNSPLSKAMEMKPSLLAYDAYASPANIVWCPFFFFFFFSLPNYILSPFFLSLFLSSPNHSEYRAPHLRGTEENPPEICSCYCSHKVTVVCRAPSPCTMNVTVVSSG